LGEKISKRRKKRGPKKSTRMFDGGESLHIFKTNNRERGGEKKFGKKGPFGGNHGILRKKFGKPQKLIFRPGREP